MKRMGAWWDLVEIGIKVVYRIANKIEAVVNALSIYIMTTS